MAYHEAGDFKYKLEDDFSSMTNTAVIAKYVGKDTHVGIPKAVDGYRVTAIGAAFSGNETVVSVTIPEGVRAIRDRAFCKCVNLRHVLLPASLDHLGHCAFMHCESLESVTIPAKIKYIQESAFSGCVNLRNVTLLGKEIEYDASSFITCHPDIAVFRVV